MPELIPLINVSNENSFSVLKCKNLNSIVVRFQDLVSEVTFKTNDVYKKIVDSGGLHNFLDFNGEILLSLIMKDEIIANFTPKLYADIINTVKPDKYTTIDGETYEGELWLSSKEIERINSENIELIHLTKKCKPVGLVKGCCPTQIKNHAIVLKNNGLDELIFHAGDFLRNGDREMGNRARLYSLIIRPYAKKLILNGVGTPRKYKIFSQADVFVTFRHYISAMNRRRCIGAKRITYQGPFNSKIVLANFEQMRENVKSLSLQSTLYAVRTK